MAVEVSSSPHHQISIETLPNAPTPSQEGLGYSRHYAQRIRDMGTSSKESWIKRIWNHMFVSKKRDDDDDEDDKNNSKAGAIVTFTTCNAQQNDKLLSWRTNKETSSNAGSNASGKPKDTLHAKSIPPPRLSERSKTLPSELANSPYLTSGDRVKYTILPPANKHRHHDDTPRHGKPKSVPSRGAHSILPPSIPHQKGSVYGNHTGPVMRRPTHPYLSKHNDHWRPKITRGYSVIQLDKRAKQIADRSIKVN